MTSYLLQAGSGLIQLSLQWLGAPGYNIQLVDGGLQLALALIVQALQVLKRTKLDIT